MQRLSWQQGVEATPQVRRVPITSSARGVTMMTDSRGRVVLDRNAALSDGYFQPGQRNPGLCLAPPQTWRMYYRRVLADPKEEDDGP